MNVYLSQEANDQLHEILDYLEENWSINVSNNFLDKLLRVMEVLEKMPYSYPASEKNLGLRKCVITRRTVAFYRVDETNQEVKILSISDSRRDL